MLHNVSVELYSVYCIQAKATFQTAMLQLADERVQHDRAKMEYKQVIESCDTSCDMSCDIVLLQLFQQLDEGHQKQNEDLNQELLEVKVGITAVYYIHQ